MMIDSLIKGGTPVVGYHDPDDKRPITIIFRPPNWEANTVYEKRYDFDYDAVMPTTYKGLYFRVKYPGKSGATDPFTGTYKAGDEIEDGTCTWEAVNYNLMPIGVTVSSVTLTGSNSVTTSSKVVTTTTLQYFIDALPSDMDSFNITMHVIYSNNKEKDYTIKFLVNEQ